ERGEDRLPVALHPSLSRLALHRFGWMGRAPSRVVRVEDGAVEVLFDDPRGRLYSAATVAAQQGDRLVIGSVTEDALLICGDG
ncbi:MAG: hypothetical protein AAFW69_12805, partial [Pseudomonadota bacterium]